ncbi:RagB/SusD family nutrient uptake outer membrane protein [Flavobacterium algicola]|uniref:RagB/SusD family nutrient uptake outer membrane protein n=1 Tax=Flavobacterium algicola TaxID=556529 RepID=UPI001EFE2D15|nr:RagB/SusD family nutrient uptake outer membrane protein [Flavobacterium algicola]MCG9791358.1 RagB/SusD family nutrient uptake outer membrane protein [Flavobacterium algicola]
MKYIKYITVILTVGVFASCSDFLSPAPSSSITSGNYYTTAEELETGLIGAYAAVKGINDYDKDNNHGVQYEFYVTEMRSDNTSTKSPDSEDASDAGQLESFSVLPTNSFVLNYYSSYFQIIYRANVILENLGVVTDTNKAAALEGEAKFLRAYAYFNLVRLFGDLPLINRVISPAETDIQYTRVSSSVIYDLIVADLDNAVSGLDPDITGFATYKTRASKAAAQALLAKVHLTIGTPDSYTKAQLLCESIINSQKFSLKDDFHDVFYTELNSEIIFAIGYENGIQNNSQLFSSEWMNAVGRTSGVNYATSDVIAAIDANGGQRVADSYREDPISTGTIRYQVAKYFPNGENGGIDGKTFTGLPRLAGNDWIILRYADVLLMHTEAIMAGASETSASTAVASFKLVRDRAGLNTPNSIKKTDLLLERRVEFAFENQRFFDLVRFGEAESVLRAFSLANDFTFDSTDLLLPIPQNEINLSKGAMNQNPGYN